MDSVEVQLERMAAAVQANAVEIRALRERGDEKHRDNTEAMAEMRDDIKACTAEVKKTNGSVAAANVIIAAHEERIKDTEASIGRLFSTSTGVVRVADLRLYVAWGLGCAATAVGAVLWVLKAVGKI